LPSALTSIGLVETTPASAAPIDEAGAKPAAVEKKHAGGQRVRSRRKARRVRAAAPVAIVSEPVPAAGEVAVDSVELPISPARSDVVAGFTAIRGELSRCAAGKVGIVEIRATISGNGRISNAVVSGVFQGTPEGSCMARVARSASFPPFSQPKLEVTFPVAL
jgi:hypothetical protein